jgi:tetratricopeptide (TPR) repeat protein
LLEAEQYILRALEIKPDDGYYLDSLGWVFFQKGEYKKALETLMKADQLAGNEAVILEHISDTLLKLDKESESLQYLEKALKGRGEEKDLIRIKNKYESLKAKISDS